MREWRLGRGMLNISDETLEPEDWQDFRRQGHRMLDDMFDYLENLRDRPVWQPIPSEVRGVFYQPMPSQSGELSAAHRTFMQHVLPYAIGNAHPGFMGWVHGGGTPVGMLAEMLAAGLNANLGGREQIPVEVERQLVRWVRDYAQVKGQKCIAAEVASAALTMLDIDEFGLDEMDNRILEALLFKFNGRAVGLKSLAVALGEEEDTIEEVYEPYLIQEGFLKRTPRGREATPLAYKHFGAEKKTAGQERLF